MNTLIHNLNKVLNKHTPVINAYHILNNYTHPDWTIYKPHSYCSFNKTLIYGNDTYQLFFLTWNNRISGWHNHSANGCLMKVLDGTLYEHYIKHDTIMHNVLNKGDIAHKLGHEYHNVIAPNICYSIHLYSPVL